MSSSFNTTRRYSPLWGFAEGFDLWLWLFRPFGQKNAFSTVLAYFRAFLVLSNNLSKFKIVNLSIFEEKEYKKNLKNPIISNNPQQKKVRQKNKQKIQKIH